MTAGRWIAAVTTGYVVAALAAATAVSLALGLVMGDLTALRPVLILAGAAFAMLFGLPGFVLARALLFLMRVESPAAFAAAGVLAALATVVLPGVLVNGGLGHIAQGHVAMTALGGAVAGAVYRGVERAVLARP